VGVTADAERLARKNNADSQLIKTLHMSALIVDLLTNECEESLQELHRVLGLYRDGDLSRLDETLDAIEEQVDQLAELLDLELNDATRYAEVLDRARVRLNEMATSAAISESHATAATPTSDPDALPRIELPEQLTEATIILDETPERTKDSSMDAILATDIPLWRESSSSSESDVASPAAGHRTGNLSDASSLYDPVGEGVRTVCEAPTSGTSDPGLLGQMETAIARSRQHRQCISMAIIEIDGFDDKLMYLSPDQICQLADTLGMVVKKLFTPEYDVVRICDSRIAVIMASADSEHSSDLLQQLIQGMKRWSEARAQKRQETLTISVGLASTGVPPRNFTADILIERAERCLSAAQHFGGNTIKSIVF
jgi:GGDEF domain-containing protein